MKNNTKVDNDSRKILIIGANGFLGSNLLRVLGNNEHYKQEFNFVAADLNNTIIEQGIPFYHIDITKYRDTMDKILKISPDILILTAAMTNVDQCEINKNLATKVNKDGAKNVIKACERINARLLFMSTDFVFDGTKTEGLYLENDAPNPLSHYGKSKLNAELLLQNSEINYLICRTAVLYGWNSLRLNFITWILDNLRQNKPISIVSDQINSPTFVKNLAEILVKLIEKNVTGIFHTAGDCALNRYEMALKCAEIFNYNDRLIERIGSLKQIALRPKNAGLDIKKLKGIIGSELKICNLDEGLHHMKKQ